jgi:hypothetical protein
VESATSKFAASRLFPLLFFIFLNLIFFFPFFFEGKIPVDANPLYQNYPWKAYDSSSFVHEFNSAKHYHNIDAALSLFPLRKEVRQQIRSGEFPFWTPNIFSGTQLVGTQVAVFDVLSPLFYLLPEGVGHGLVIILQFILAGWFMFLFCRSLGLSTPASLLAGIAFMWNSHFMRWFGTVSYNATLCWLPLILYSVHRIAHGKRSGFHLLVLSLTAQFLGDHPQLWIYNLTAFGAYFLYQLLNRRNDAPASYYKFRVVSAFLISLLLSSPELFSVASALRNSPRGSSETADMYVGRNFLSPRKLPTLVVPDLFGATENNVLSKLLLKPPKEGEGGFWERIIFGQPGSVYNRVLAYVGFLPILFALVAISLWRDSRIRFFSLLAMLPLLFLVLMNFKIFNEFINFFWRGARTLDHSRILVLSVFSFSILAAFGVDTIQASSRRLMSLLKVVTVVFALLFFGLLIGNFAGSALKKSGFEYYSKNQNSFPWNQNAKSFYLEGFSLVPGMHEETAKILIPPLLICLGTMISFILLNRQKISLPICMWTIVGITGLDLLYHGRTDPPIYFNPAEAFAPKQIESLEFLSQNLQTSRVMEIQKLKDFLDVPLTKYSSLDEYYTRGIRFFDFNSFEFVARPDSLMHYSISTSSGYLGFYPARYFRLHHGRPNDILHYVKRDETADIFNGGWIDMQSILYILAKPGSTSKIFPVVHASSGLTIFENPKALPLVYLSQKIKVIPDSEEALKHIRNSTFNPNDYTVLEEQTEISETETEKGSVTIIRKTSSTMTIKVHSVADSLLVFTENFYPGWRAFVNGKEVRILKANYTFQGIPIPAGDHTIKFSFEVVYFRLAVAFTAIGLLLWFLFFVKLA